MPLPRENNILRRHDKFVQFLSLVGSVYKPPETEPSAELPQATAQLPDELLSVPLPAGTAFVYKDIANFDVGFHISDVESDSNDDFDTSADIFL